MVNLLFFLLRILFVRLTSNSEAKGANKEEV